MERGSLLLAASLSISNLLENPVKYLPQNLLIALDRLKNVIKPVKKTCALMFRDERGVLEPHADLLSVALAVTGFMVFAALMSQTYFGYEDRSFALENYETASLLAESLADDPIFEAGSPGLLSAAALDTLSSPDGVNERRRFFATFSGNYRFLVEIRAGNSQWHWQIMPDNAEPETFSEDREKVAASVPVVIELNPAQSVSGTLTVVIYKAEWT
jgi:hypothetical protein